MLGIAAAQRFGLLLGLSEPLLPDAFGLVLGLIENRLGGLLRLLPSFIDRFGGLFFGRAALAGRNGRAAA